MVCMINCVWTRDCCISHYFLFMAAYPYDSNLVPNDSFCLKGILILVGSQDIKFNKATDVAF